MSSRLKRIKAKRSPKRSNSRAGATYLLSVGKPDCDCPICRAMGIDLDASGGTDIRRLDSREEIEAVYAMLEEARRASSN